jgi:hypothetical protein
LRAAALASSSSSAVLRTSPIEQFIYTLDGGGSMAFPLPVGSGVLGGGEGILRTDERKSPSLRSLPLWIRRKRCLEVGGGMLVRIRCFRAIAVVELGEAMSRGRSGIEVVKRTVRRRGGGSEDMMMDGGEIWISSTLWW